MRRALLGSQGKYRRPFGGDRPHQRIRQVTSVFGFVIYRLPVDISHTCLAGDFNRAANAARRDWTCKLECGDSHGRTCEERDLDAHLRNVGY